MDNDELLDEDEARLHAILGNDGVGLSWLCCKDETSEAFILLDDYGVWHTNY